MQLASAAQVPWHDFAAQVFPKEVGLGAKIGHPVVFESDVRRYFIPASVTKMITAATALQALGGDFKFQTQLKWKQVGTEAHEVELIGDGDPSLTLKSLQEIAAAFKQNGVLSVVGSVRVRAADPIWNTSEVPSGNLNENLVWCYGAQPSAIMIDTNCALYAVTGERQGHWFESGVSDSVQVDLQKGSSNQIDIKLAGDHYVITGTVNTKTLPFYYDLRVLHPMRRAQVLMTQALSQAGMIFKSHEDLKDVETIVEKSFTLSSLPLRELLPFYIKPSLNPPMEMIHRQLGRKSTLAEGTLLEKSVTAVMQFLESEFKSEGSRPYFADGSGLSRSNFLNAEWVYDFLNQQKQKPYFKELLGALSVGGKDGTLKERWTGTVAEGHVFAKTGTLNGHSNVVGYLGESLTPFVLLNDFVGQPVELWKVRDAQNKMVLKWFEDEAQTPTGILSGLGRRAKPLKHEFLIRDIE